MAPSQLREVTNSQSGLSGRYQNPSDPTGTNFGDLVDLPLVPNDSGSIDFVHMLKVLTGIEVQKPVVDRPIQKQAHYSSAVVKLTRTMYPPSSPTVQLSLCR